MNDTSGAEIGEALNALYRLPFGSARYEAGRRLWEQARHAPDPFLRFRVLAAAMEAACFGGAPDYTIVLFPELSALKREHPEAVDGKAYIWRLKWVVGDMPDYPEIPRQRVDQAIAEYTKAIREYGAQNSRAIEYLRFKTAVAMTDVDTARTAHAAFSLLRRDEHSDCMACEANERLKYAILEGNWPAARDAAAPFFEGRFWCAEVPHISFAALILPALAAGDFAFARQCSERGLKMIAGNVSFLEAAGGHLLWLAAFGDTVKVTRHLKRHTPWLSQVRSPVKQFRFLTAAAAACRFLAQSDRKLLLDMPEAWNATHGKEAAPASRYAEWFLHEARKLAQAFDLRNGNAAFSSELANALAVVERGVPESEAPPAGAP